MSALSSPEEGIIRHPLMVRDRRAVFLELEKLRHSAMSVQATVESLHPQVEKFTAIRDHVRLALKPCRDYLRHLSTSQGPVTAEQQLVRLLVFERKIQFGFRATFQSCSHGSAMVNGFSSGQMSSALLANTITPVAHEVAFKIVKQVAPLAGPVELRLLTNKYVNKLRARRSKYIDETQPLQDRLDDYVVDSWPVLFEACQIYTSLTEIASTFQATIQQSSRMGMK